ncbi:hypothetical protein [Pseudoroseomonas cervicalis]|uniref:hypothetical protein n=1 Tax=Teichococcus cervicalis TaxID=204525 RepID=UPI0022F19EE6|nr:hypothetical protein [Pseudoroseomonas cervicalis]WBV41359.1 hypothetical protein PFY06_08810 [Pseudoroseomonas cervicalis]
MPQASPSPHQGAATPAEHAAPGAPLGDAQLDGVVGGVAALSLPKPTGPGGEPESYQPEYAHG